MERMTATDAQTYWMSASIPNDQFLAFAFVGVRDALDEIGVHLGERAESIPDLCLRVRDVPATLDYPYWVPAKVGADQVRVHPTSSWAAVLDDLAAAMSHQLDLNTAAWCVHLFGPLDDVPSGRGERAVVAVLQIAHALADGSRATRIARALFDSRPLDAAAPTAERMPSRMWSSVALARAAIRAPLQLATLTRRASQAHRAHGDLARAIESGVIIHARPGNPRTAVNAAPGDRRALRVVVTDSARLRDIGGSVTVGALVVIGEALAAHLAVPSDSGLSAEVTVAKPGKPIARNHFRNAGVDLHVGEPDRSRRAELIRSELDQVRVRAAHRLTGAESAAMALVPAPLVHWGVRSFDTTVVPDLVTGNTVVSSVNRGAADLVLGGGTVCVTAGFPALSPVQALTHGVHGIGDTVAVSITASPDVVTDLDGYRDRIVAALG